MTFMCRCFLVLLLSLCFPLFSAQAATGGGRDLLRDYAVPFGQAEKRLEISVDYVGMNDTLDVFNIRDSEISTVDGAYQSNSLGDLSGGQLLINYGLSDATNLHFKYGYKDLSVSFADFQVHQYELSLRRSMTTDWRGLQPLFSFDAGIRGDLADDQSFDSMAEINSIVRRVDPSLSVTDTGSHIIFQNDTASVFVPKAGKSPLSVSLDDMQDTTGFLRFSLGHSFGLLVPSLFVEGGYTQIDGQLGSTVDEYLPASLYPGSADYNQSLDRDEWYWKAGFDLYLTTPIGVTANLQYEYIRLNRDSGLNDSDYNHILRGDLSYFLNEKVAVNLGVSYYSRQYNGELPLLYNSYTQSSFDHQYGEVRFGLVFFFGQN